MRTGPCWVRARRPHLQQCLVGEIFAQARIRPTSSISDAESHKRTFKTRVLASRLPNAIAKQAVIFSTGWHGSCLFFQRHFAVKEECCASNRAYPPACVRPVNLG